MVNIALNRQERESKQTEIVENPANQVYSSV